jgi:hypothetical protein
MFDELDKLMHERPVNQMALAAWAMRMHAVLKQRLPVMDKAMTEAESHTFDQANKFPFAMSLYQSVMEIWNQTGIFYETMTKTEESDNV